MESKLLDFDSDLWEKYRSGAGTIKYRMKSLTAQILNNPDLLEKTEQEEEYDCKEDFDDLCEALWHQMSFYPASYLAIPYFEQFLIQKEKENDFHWQVAILTNIGMCLATDIPANKIYQLCQSVSKEILDNYQKSIEIIKEKAKTFVMEHIQELKKLVPDELSMFCTGLLAILGDREAAFVLIVGSWAQCYPLCKHCEFLDEEIELDLFNQKLIRDIEEKIQPAPKVIGQWDYKSFDNTYLWFSNFLALLGDQEGVEKLSYYYGTYTCPKCGKQGNIMELVKAGLLEA